MTRKRPTIEESQEALRNTLETYEKYSSRGRRMWERSHELSGVLNGLLIDRGEDVKAFWFQDDIQKMIEKDDYSNLNARIEKEINARKDQ